LFYLDSGMEVGSLKITCGDTDIFKTCYGVKEMHSVALFL